MDKNQSSNEGKDDGDERQFIKKDKENGFDEMKHKKTNRKDKPLAKS